MTLTLKISIALLLALTLFGCGSNSDDRRHFEFVVPAGWDSRDPGASGLPYALEYFVLEGGVDDLVAVTVIGEPISDSSERLTRDGESIPSGSESPTLSATVESLTQISDVPRRTWEELPKGVPATDWGKVHPTTLAGVEALEATAKFRAPNGKTGEQNTVFGFYRGTFYTVQLGGTPAAAVRAATPEFSEFLRSWNWE